MGSFRKLHFMVDSGRLRGRLMGLHGDNSTMFVYCVANIKDRIMSRYNYMMDNI